MGIGISVSELRENLSNLPLEEHSKALELLNSMKIDISTARGELTGTEVSGFVFDGKVHQADSHKDIFIKLSQLVTRKHPEKAHVLLTIQGRTKKYFSTSPKDFKHGYERIKGTDYYADTNENAAQLNRRCQRVLQDFWSRSFNIHRAPRMIHRGDSPATLTKLQNNHEWNWSEKDPII